LVHRVEGLTAPSRLQRRYVAIRQFEQDLVGNGTMVLKVMLHISREEQYQRLSQRLDDPTKHWKFTPADVDAREQWDAYMEAHRIAIEETDTDDAPWFVIPADRKWYGRLAVQQLLIETLASLDMTYPAATCDIAEQRRRLDASRYLTSKASIRSQYHRQPCTIVPCVLRVTGPEDHRRLRRR